jgi:hypothetical protein
VPSYQATYSRTLGRGNIVGWKYPINLGATFLQDKGARRWESQGSDKPHDFFLE